MREIIIKSSKHGDKTVQVDDDMFPLLQQLPFIVSHNDGIDLRISIYRLIYWLKHGKHPDPGLCIDHIDGNRLNNQMSNLRPATDAQNRWNSRPHRTNVTGYKGVSRDENDCCVKYRAACTANGGGKARQCGYFDCARDAAIAVDIMALRMTGNSEYVRLNVPDASDEDRARITPLIDKAKRKGGNSKYLGVCRLKNGRWLMQAWDGQRQIKLGYFALEEDAAKAYDHFVLTNQLDSRLNLPGTSREELEQAWLKRNHNPRKTSQYRGVHFDKRLDRWVASLRVGRRSLFRRTFRTELEAANAYNLQAKHHLGDKARLNPLPLNPPTT